MFLICSAPSLLPSSSPLSLLSPPIPVCFHFSSQEVIYCQTHSNSQPQLHTLIYPNRPRRFYFSHFLSSFRLLPWWNITASSTSVFFFMFEAHLFIRVSVISSQRAVLSVLASPLVVCYSIVCLFPCFWPSCSCLFVLFFFLF